MTARLAIASGQTFSKLTAIREVDAELSGSHRRRRWMFRCGCGVEKAVRLAHVVHGRVVSCGCDGGSGNLAHGHAAAEAQTPTYRSWCSMKTRCTNAGNHKYPEYGGRGITISPRWLDSFEQFLDDMGERPQGTSLDRWPNNDGNYEPGNCRWATPKQQANNRRKARRNVRS